MKQYFKKMAFFGIFSLLAMPAAFTNEEKIAQEFLLEAKKNIQSFHDPYLWASTSLHYIHAEKPKDEKKAENEMKYALNVMALLKKQYIDLGAGVSKILFHYDKKGAENFIESHFDPMIKFLVYLDLLKNYPNLSVKEREKCWDRAEESFTDYPFERIKAECMSRLVTNQADYDLKRAEKTARSIGDKTYRLSSLAYLGSKFLSKDLAKARSLYSEAKEIMTEISDSSERAFASGLFSMWLSEFDRKEAKKILETAISVVQSVEDSPFLKCLLYTTLVEASTIASPENSKKITKEVLSLASEIKHQDQRDQIFHSLANAYLKTNVDKAILYASMIKNEEKREENFLELAKTASLKSISDAQKIISKLSTKPAKTHAYCEAYKQYQLRKQKENK